MIEIKSYQEIDQMRDEASPMRSNQTSPRRQWRKRVGGLFLIFGCWVIGQPVQALPDYLKIFAADPLSRPELRTQCAVCHVDPRGGGERTAFGQAFAAAGHAVTPALRQEFPALFQQASLPPVRFVEGSDSEAIVTIEGREYAINTRTKTVRELETAAPPPVAREEAKTAPVPTQSDSVYRAADLRLVNLPTAIPIPKGSLWTDFTHRFPFGRPTNVEGLFGLDAQALPSFGFVYGLTDRIHLGAYRSPGDLGRPIQVSIGANLFSEQRGDALTAMVRLGLEGRDNLRRQYTTSLEATIARSLTRHAQLYIVPTLSFGDRPFTANLNEEIPGTTAFALGSGIAVNVRPSVALLGEANYRLTEAARYRDLGQGIRRPVYGFGIQKASVSRRHAFTLTFSNGPGTTFSQRSQTRGLYFADDSLRGLTIGFNLSRRLF
jgi:hypothetical protein